MNTTLSHRDSLIQIYSDVYKDAYGFRSRGINYDAMSTEELEADLERFSAITKENMAEEARAEKAAVEQFYTAIDKLISVGAGDEATALRWMADSGVADSGWDIDFYLWKLGISTYSVDGKAIHDKLMPYWSQALSQVA